MSEQAAWGDEIVQLAELFHNIYEEEARRFGWKSQTPVPFGELPEANAQTMLCTVARVRREVCADRDELRAELARVTAERDEALDRIERARAEIREFKAAGEYEFKPTTAPEAFLQQELKQLMSALLAILEGDTE